MANDWAQLMRDAMVQANRIAPGNVLQICFELQSKKLQASASWTVDEDSHFRQAVCRIVVIAAALIFAQLVSSLTSFQVGTLCTCLFSQPHAIAASVSHGML